MMLSVRVPTELRDALCTSAAAYRRALRAFVAAERQRLDIAK